MLKTQLTINTNLFGIKKLLSKYGDSVCPLYIDIKPEAGLAMKITGNRLIFLALSYIDNLRVFCHLRGWGQILPSKEQENFFNWRRTFWIMEIGEADFCYLILFMEVFLCSVHNAVQLKHFKGHWTFEVVKVELKRWCIWESMLLFLKKSFQ